MRLPLVGACLSLLLLPGARASAGPGGEDSTSGPAGAGSPEPAPTADGGHAPGAARLAPASEARSAFETIVRAPTQQWSSSLSPSAAGGADPSEALDRSGEATKVRRGGQSFDLVVRGLQRDNVPVTVDGDRVFGACPNRMDPPTAHVDMAELELIEVRKGPFDVASPGALGGSIRMNTRAPRPGFHADLRIGYGSFNDLRSSASVSFGGERFDGSLGGTFRQAQPYQTGNGTRVTGLYAPTAANRYRAEADEAFAHRSGGGFVKAGFRPRDGHRLEVSYTQLLLRDAFYPYLLMDAAVDDTYRAAATYRVDRLWGLRDGEARLFVNLVRHDMDDSRRCSSTLTPVSCDGALERGWGMRTRAASQLFGARLQATAGGGESSAWGDTLLGLDLDDRRWDATTTRSMLNSGVPSYVDQASLPNVGALRAGLFAENRRALAPGLRLTAGIRLDGSTAAANKDRTSLYRVYFPQGALPLRQIDLLWGANARLEYQVIPRLTLSLGFGHAERAPDPQERYFALAAMGAKPGTVGQPTLKPSGNTEADLGARFVHSSLRISGSLFASRLGGLVVPVSLSGQDGSAARSYANVEALMLGGEVSARLALAFGFSLRAGLTSTRGARLGTRTPLPEIPPLHAQVALRFEWSWFFAEASEYYAARQDRVDTALHEEPTSAWYVTHLELGAKWRDLRFTAEARNLFGRQYVEHLSYLRDPFASGVRVPEPGRSLMATVQYAF